MREDTTIPLRNPALRDELSELLRAGARRIIRQAVEAELAAYLEAHAGDRDAQGRRAVVRNGYLPSREVLTGVGPVRVQVPRTRGQVGRGPSLPLGAFAAVSAEGAACGGGDTVAVPEGGIDERLRRGAHGAVRRVGGGLVAGEHLAAQGGLGARVCAVARAGVAWGGVRVSVGGRHLRERAQRGAALSSGGRGLRRARPQALPGPGGRLPGIEGELEGGFVAPAGAGREGGEARRGRRGAGVVVGPGRGVPRDPGAALLGAQDGERSRQAAQERSARSAADAV